MSDTQSSPNGPTTYELTVIAALSEIEMAIRGESYSTSRAALLASDAYDLWEACEERRKETQQ
jgi:hypothetical protein